MIERVKPYVLWLALPLFCGLLGGMVAGAQAQFVPPPPVRVTAESCESFTSDDRIKLRQAWAMIKRMHAVVVPLRSQDALLNSGEF